MADLADGEYMISSIQWRKRDEEGSLRPLHDFTTGTLSVDGGTIRIQARFTDQNLSNRFSDFEQDGVPLTLHVSVLDEPDVYQIPGQAPTLERSGACYVLRVRGASEDATVAQAV